MGRWHVHVVHMRARDVRVGDVVAKDPDRFDGWFRVHEIRQLGNGTFNILDKANERSFTAGPFDLVGLQTPVQLPAEAERTARTDNTPRPNSVGSPNPAQPAGSPSAPVDAQPDSNSSPAARREAAAREASGGARALPGG